MYISIKFGDSGARGNRVAEILNKTFSFKLLSDSLLSSSSKVALNSSQDHERIMVDNPVSFSEMLVVKMKELLQGITEVTSDKACGNLMKYQLYKHFDRQSLKISFYLVVMKDPELDTVDAQSLLVLSTSPSYVLLLKEVQKLRWIDVDMLVSDEDKLCFFTNVLNMLLCHAAITELAECSSTTNPGSRSQSHEDPSNGNKSWSEGLPRLDFSYCRASYLKKYGYIIGKLGFVR